MTGAVWAVAGAHDLAAAGIAVIASAAFGALGVFLRRRGRKLRAAEEVLERQLHVLNGPRQARSLEEGTSLSDATSADQDSGLGDFSVQQDGTFT
jgi:hypothetical protein